MEVGTGAQISNNIAHDGQQDKNHSEGIWSYDSLSTVIRNNQVYNWQFHGADSGPYPDAMAFDTDDCDIGATIEYNWSHDNQGGFLLLVQDSKLAIVRYNISERDGYGSQNAVRAFLIHNKYDSSQLTGDGMQVYDNNIYMDDKYAGSPNYSPGTGLFQPNTFQNQQWTTAPFFENNLVENLRNLSQDQYASCAIPSGWSVDYNQFYGGSQSSYPCNATAPENQQHGGYGPTADPKFASAGNGWQAISLQGVITAYSLQSGSPAICNGTNLESAGVDFAGVQLPSSGSVDAGALEVKADAC